MVTGRLQSGILAVGMKAKINNIEAEVLGIEAFRASIKSISSTDPISQHIGVLLKDIKKEDIQPYAQLKRPIIIEGIVPTNLTTSSQIIPTQKNYQTLMVLAAIIIFGLIVFLFLNLKLTR